MSQVIVPVGFDMGPVYAETGPPDRAPLRYEVHLGGDPQELTAEEYTAWKAAFSDPDAHVNLEFDRARLDETLRTVDHAPAGRLADPTTAVNRLLRVGLLLEFDPEAGEGLAEPFGIRRLYPRAHGLGTSDGMPDLYGIGYPGDRFVEIPTGVYNAWNTTLLEPTLWDACEIIAEIATEIGAQQEEPVEVPASELAGDVAVQLPLLVSGRAAFLDLLNYELVHDREASAWPVKSPSVHGGRPPVIVPVGLPLGYDHSLGVPEDHPDTFFHVHLGLEYEDLTLEEFVAWGAAFADPVRHGRLEVTRAHLEERLRTAEGDDRMAEPGPVVERLLERGLLVEFEPAEGPLEELFRAVQVFPLGDGMGNTAERPDMYHIGVSGESQVSVPPELYAIWSYAMTCGSLWEACVALAEGADEDLAPGEQPMLMAPEALARGMAGALPAMISAGCAFLDPLNYVR